MLRLKNIKKYYKVADTRVEALKGISLSFRKSEFVSILGPSGCGKTTTLNIIGGLDKYSSGDLFINGKSTKEFSNHDWDVYRNHRIGFIFQSYNLIPHQTILGNVELSLTIAGVSKEERTRRAKEALDRVGLKGQYNKKPNQLSGGQCQRVAIARALVNEPEILLADEPTGALDTQTSIQIMDLIKEISKEKLVIMVTHNPELAMKYSTRIIKLLDGEVVDDSNPFSEENEIAEDKENPISNSSEKAKMSFFTAFKLSFKNLLSKKARTILTCIAGSIGIIGISMVLAVSSGVKGYIKNMQDDMLSGNPITITEQAIDYTALMNTMTITQKTNFIKEANKVNVNSLINSLVKSSQMMVKNDITKDYIDYVKQINSDDVSCITYDYGFNISNNIYTSFSVNNTKTNLSLTAIKEIYTSVLKGTEFKQYASYVTNLASLFAQAPDNEDYIKSQYNVLYGNIATKEDEIMVVLDSNSAITDLVLAQLGYYTQEEFLNLAYKASNSADYNESLYKDKFSYDEILNKEFSWYPNNSIYVRNEASVNFPFTYNAYENKISGNKTKLKIVGILEPKSDISYGCMTSGFYYTSALSQKTLASAKESEIIKYLDNNNLDGFSGGVIYDTNTGINKFSGQAIVYQYDYYDNKNVLHANNNGFLGTSPDYSFMLGMMGGSSGSSLSSYYTITKRELGGNDLANSISIYPTNFETKNNVTDYLDIWNSDADIVLNGVTLTKDQRVDVKYSDAIALMITMINSMINLVTYALIAFTSLSLVVSCVMIAIITYVSVMERIKEIGVIRSLGGRKSDVSHLFNAETFIIGAVSGLFGILITYLLSGIANLIVGSLSGIYTLASLPWTAALIMIALSIVLTLISGLIPARSAAKKDPVTALRSE